MPDAEIEVIVLNNCSSDGTESVISANNLPLAPIIAINRDQNIGPDENIASAYDLARGIFVWVLGDDDLPVPRTLAWLLNLLATHHPALVYVRPYGYDVDATIEFPAILSGESLIRDPSKFVRRVGAHITFISSMVVNKSLLPDVSAKQFVGLDLSQVSVFLSAIMRGKLFIASQAYRVAAKRNNSGGYDLSEVFVDSLGQVFTDFLQRGIQPQVISALDRIMILRYFPQRITLDRLARQDLAVARTRFRSRYRRYFCYWIVLDPIFSLPRFLAIPFGLLVTIVGRSATGDFHRALKFLTVRARRAFMS